MTGPAGLHLLLESPLPGPLPAGRATAVWLAGRCWHRSRQITGLEIDVDGIRHSVRTLGMPRPDVYAAVHGPGWATPTGTDDPEGHSYRSGFWATVPIPGRAKAGSVELRAVVQLGDGGELTASLGELPVEEAPRQPVGPERDLIAICMATFEPDEALFRAQVDSLRAQTYGRWVCVISDDCSAPERFERMEAVIGDDPRFTLSRAPERLGYYHNFERALGLAPAEAGLIALSDQDDRWHPDKLARLRDALGGAMLAYSDQRLVRPDGRLISETMWRGRRNNHTNLASILVANTITGAASLMRREVAELARPFPIVPGSPVPRPLARRPRAGRRRGGLRRAPAIGLRPAPGGRAGWGRDRGRGTAVPSAGCPRCAGASSTAGDSVTTSATWPERSRRRRRWRAAQTASRPRSGARCTAT